MQPVGISAELGRDQFMRLLVTQMRNQNPLDPIQDAEFIAQLAQFSSLEGIEKLNNSFGDMLALQQFTQGANLIGKVVIYQDGDGGGFARGTVDGVTVRGGTLGLMVGGRAVLLHQVRGMVSGE